MMGAHASDRLTDAALTSLMDRSYRALLRVPTLGRVLISMPSSRVSLVPSAARSASAQPSPVSWSVSAMTSRPASTAAATSSAGLCVPSLPMTMLGCASNR